jgi:DNA-binding MarR family transcriptional regulator
MGMIQDSPGNPAKEDELRVLVEALSRRVNNLEVQCGADMLPRELTFTDEKLATIASSIYRARRRRTKLFDKNMFSEPAWDMLLDLFINGVRGLRVSSTSLCHAADVPVPTGLRWIILLENKGLLRRQPGPHDGRVAFLEISDRGTELMRKYVLDGVTKFEMPLPD